MNGIIILLVKKLSKDYTAHEGSSFWIRFILVADFHIYYLTCTLNADSSLIC